uniref:CRC domain-containing protein n=1 Tax=Syphacia muris TaxID=451379 RepID=A0A0N5ARM7_9BILA
MDKKNSSPLKRPTRKHELRLQSDYLKAASNVCLENGVPLPFVTFFSSKADTIFKGFRAEKQSTYCCRCSLRFNNPKSFCLRLVKLRNTKGRKKLLSSVKCSSQIQKNVSGFKKCTGAIYVCAVCKGCGCYMKCGIVDCCAGLIRNEISFLEAETSIGTKFLLPKQNSVDKLSISALSASTPVSLNQTPKDARIGNSDGSRKLTFSRRRHSAQKLQRMLMSEEESKLNSPLSGLSSFLSSL